MSNLARKLQHEQQQTVQSPKADVARGTAWLTPGEKILALVFGIMVCFGAAFIVSKQAAIYEVNKDIQLAESTIDEQKKVNIDLGNQVDELSRYERIWEKAKELGLTLNENNVKVVQD
ncbi:cell division protein FtsL [Mesobacillus zeae]|uniref:Cell division protein FtsL n=1 Tax=Mesobacillus zeae TaxID=1917180 RepID=A0A398BKK6_9BACI|nr:cell division protein FtsL [Mesobacillus zeae]RID87903.1 cell division protein FtsL [Mesobacillus zeae]